MGLVKAEAGKRGKGQITKHPEFLWRRMFAPQGNRKP
jgi:hypothetical protein